MFAKYCISTPYAYHSSKQHQRREKDMTLSSAQSLLNWSRPYTGSLHHESKTQALLHKFYLCCISIKSSGNEETYPYSNAVS